MVPLEGPLKMGVLEGQGRKMQTAVGVEEGERRPHEPKVDLQNNQTVNAAEFNSLLVDPLASFC